MNDQIIISWPMRGVNSGVSFRLQRLRLSSALPYEWYSPMPETDLIVLDDEELVIKRNGDRVEICRRKVGGPW